MNLEKKKIWNYWSINLFKIQHQSEAISTMFYADGYIEIEELESIIEKGDKRIVFSF